MANIDLVKLTEQTKKLTAMIVEDEIVANELLESTFSNFFEKVYSAKSAQEALEIYAKSKPDVVFVDLIMEGMNGIELSRKLREEDPNQIIVVISASNDMDMISSSIAIGVNSFIQKPIDTQKVIDVMNSIASMITRKKKIETKTFSISLPMDLYELVDDHAASESISKNAVIIRALRQFYQD